MADGNVDITSMLLSRLTTTGILAAQKAGDVLKKAFGNCGEIENKEGKHNLVTEYDRKVEKLIIEFIQNNFPDHTFLGEESGTSSENPQAIHWIIDPIDGTVNFAHNIPIFSICIAATFQGKVLCGIVYDPIHNEFFVAEKGRGAFLNGSPISVSSNNVLAESVLAVGFPYNIQETPECIDHFTRIAKLGLPIRRLGSAALDLVYVASGRVDGFFEISLNPWDFAAAKLIIEEAGGRFTDYSANDVDILSSSSICATNGILHDQLLDHLSLSPGNNANDKN